VRSARVFACHLEPREPSTVRGLDFGEGQGLPASLREAYDGRYRARPHEKSVPYQPRYTG